MRYVCDEALRRSKRTFHWLSILLIDDYRKYKSGDPLLDKPTPDGSSSS